MMPRVVSSENLSRDLFKMGFQAGYEIRYYRRYACDLAKLHIDGLSLQQRRWCYSNILPGLLETQRETLQSSNILP